jgi:putative FmdB family regulatory protein
MPTYEFRCPQGHEFERFFRKMNDAAAELPCPECGAVATRQLSAGAGLLFKGSGFYLTDYGKNAHRRSAPAAGKSGDSKAGDSKSGDSKTDGTGEGKASDSTAGAKETSGAAESKSGDKQSTGGGEKAAPKTGGSGDKS